MTTSEQPDIEQRPARRYACVGDTVRMDRVSAIADRFPEVFASLAQQGVAPVGAPFLRYRTIDMPRALHIEACIPIDGPLPAEGPISADTLPGGRYAVLTHRGHFGGLQDTAARLLSWADDRNLEWDVRLSDGGEEWAGRVEIYETDPATEPDPSRWVTVLAVKLAD